MYPVSNLDAAIAFGGFGAGLVLGCAKTLRKTGSFTKQENVTRERISFLSLHLDCDRDRTGYRIFSKGLILTPRVWNPFLPLEHIAPLSLIVISQVFFAAITPQATATAIATLAATYTFRIIVLPLVLNAAVFCGAANLRIRLQNYTNGMGLDVSGHALSQSASAVYKLFALSALSSLNLVSNPYRMVAAITSLSDYLWTYETASNHHNVMDMAVSMIYMSIAFAVVYTRYEPTAQLAAGAWSVLAAKLSIK